MDLYQYIGHPELLNHDSLYELRSLLARYPYYQAARLLYLQNLYLLHDSSFGEELRKAAVYVADCRALFDMIEGKNYVIEPHERSLEEESEIKKSDRTLSLIDQFLRSLPSVEGDKKNVPVNPATDYVGYLMQMDDLEPEKQVTEPDRTDDLINQFITSHPPTGHVELSQNTSMPTGVSEPVTIPSERDIQSVEDTVSENDNYDLDDSCLTETLAKIYVKQRRYVKALEIIRRLYLKNPKKSAYFADQMRFLEKLIINNKNNKE